MTLSMRDVAQHAGVSISTVSHVINNTRHVSEETRARVLASIEELNYQPNTMARIFKMGRKNLIGIIVPDIADSVWSIIIGEVSSVLAQHGMNLIIVNTKRNRDQEIESLRLLSTGIVDGMIIASSLEDYGEVLQNVPDDFPVVLIDRMLKNCACDTVMPNDYHAVYAGVGKLIAEGNRRIGIVTGSMALSIYQQRLEAYHNAMQDNGLAVEDGFVQHGSSRPHVLRPLLQNLLDLDCSAIVLSNNVMLNEAMYFFSEQGLRVGRDIFLLGQMLENRRDYSLRRVDKFIQPSTEIGRIAARRILDRCEQPDRPISHDSLYTIYERRSIDEAQR